MKNRIFKYGGAAVYAFIAMVAVAAAAQASIALLLNIMIDTASEAVSSGELSGLARLAAFCCVFTVIFGFVIYLKEALEALCVKRIMNGVRCDAADGILNMKISDFYLVGSAEYVTLLNQNLSVYENDYLKNLIAVYESVLDIAFGTVLLFYINPAVAVISIAAMAIPGLIPMLFGKKLMAGQKKIMEATEKYNAGVGDMLGGFDVIYSFRAHDVFRRRGREASSKMEESKENLARTKAALMGVVNFASPTVQFLIMTIAGVFAVYGYITVGSIVAVVQLSGQIVSPAFSLSSKLGAIKSTYPIREKIGDIVKTLPRANNVCARELTRELAIKNVSFSYGEIPVLKDLNFTLRAGGKYAVLGRSGSGKSTLLKLIAGYYDNYTGEIKTDGQANVPRDVAVISQEVFIFDGTVRENITLFEDFPENEISAAVRGAGLDGVISELDNGLDTPAGEGGKRFSGGERQRIAVARAILRKKKLLLLDEATSMLDAEHSRQIEQEILGLDGVTCVFVTHKLTPGLADRYDKIFVMENGKITVDEDISEHSDVVNTSTNPFYS